ncbi:MAG TPA: cardiolipin synthase [Victivallales bacterium]|nr:cardiolipin synthase [Victivallales bacterium]
MILDFLLYSQLQFSTWFVLFVFFIVLDVITIIHVLINKHDEASSALLWIFLIIVLNVIGVIIYVILGINRVNSTGSRIEKAHIKMLNLRKSENRLSKYLNALLKFNYSGPTKDYLKIMDRILPETYPVTGNKVYLLEDGTAAYPRMLKAIQNAKDHIHLQSYIIMNDRIATKLFDALADKAKNDGVKVKVLFDRLGSKKAYSKHFFNKWAGKSHNFEIRAFSKFNLLAPYRIQLRNHRKLLICDGKIAFIGGINISTANIVNLKNKYIHDLHCEITGPSIGEFQFSFLRDWNFVTKIKPYDLLSKANYFPIPKKCGNAIVRAIPSGPGQAYEASKKLFMSAVAGAKESIWIITPYFVPDKSFIQLLCMASARGVDIRIIIPQNNNHWYVRYATRSFYNTLLKYNIRIFEKKGLFSHVKATLIDGTWGTMGSSNCDMRSFRLNYELDFAVEDEDFINTLHRQFLHEIKGSDEITASVRMNRTFYEEIIEDFCSLLTPIL